MVRPAGFVPQGGSEAIGEVGSLTGVFSRTTFEANRPEGCVASDREALAFPFLSTLQRPPCTIHPNSISQITGRRRIFRPGLEYP